MEGYLTLSFLNDFVFCPRSIYFHQLYGRSDERTYKQKPQIEGTFAHKAIDEKSYATSKHILQGIDIYSDEYNICGKIDIFDTKKGLLTERKKRITVIYDGYIFQLYAQYYALSEMGYEVKSMRLYSMDTNTIFAIPLPSQDTDKREAFEQLLQDISAFDIDDDFTPNPTKCANCIYSNLCDRSVC